MERFPILSSLKKWSHKSKCEGYKHHSGSQRRIRRRSKKKSLDIGVRNKRKLNVKKAL